MTRRRSVDGSQDVALGLEPQPFQNSAFTLGLGPVVKGSVVHHIPHQVDSVLRNPFSQEVLHGGFCGSKKEV